MEIFGCGHNTGGDLGEPCSRLRGDVGWQHYCQHNNSAKDSHYCPLWVLKPKEIGQAGETIRVISCADDSVFLDVDGELRQLYDHCMDRDLLREATRSWDISNIMGISRLADGLAFLVHDGALVTVRKSAGVHRFDGKLIQHIAMRRVDWHNPRLVSGAVAIVLKCDPRTVLSFDSWEPVCSFLESPESPESSHHPLYTESFSSPIVKLTNKFAVLTEGGEVFMWGDKLPQQPPDPPDYDEDEFDSAMFDFVLGGIPITKWPSWEPELLDYEAKRQPLPPIKLLSTGGANNVAVSHSGQLFVWGYKTNKWPEIDDVNNQQKTEFEEAKVQNASTPLNIQSAASGRNHVIVLAVDGSL